MVARREARFRAVEQRLLRRYGIAAVERWAEVPDPPVTVRIQELGAGAPTVLVNGIAAPGMAFAPLLPHLGGRRLLVLDLPGHGLAPPHLWQGQPVRGQAVSILSGVLDALEIDKAPFVAHSLGGMFALWLALDRPGRASALALLGEPATALPGARGNALMGALTAPVIGRAVQWAMRLPSPRSATRRGLAGGIGPAAARGIPPELVDLLGLSLRLPGRSASFRSLLRRLLDGRAPRSETVLSEDELRTIGQPALFVWGEDDVFLSADGGRPSVEKMGKARLEVVPGGHAPWLDDPETCGALVRQFLDTARSV